MSKITWLENVGCCPHGLHFRDNEYQHKSCIYCDRENAEHPEKVIIEELREINRKLNNIR